MAQIGNAASVPGGAGHLSHRNGAIFMPFFHYVEAAANLLTNATHDPMAELPEFKVCAARIGTM
ncbi:MAG: hypothetical protein E4H20_10475 [Spirochaetales bacterium]|nr:MAG: hypothetical protein E4H20_10475 [Spirochaetales bacterium]